MMRTGWLLAILAAAGCASKSAPTEAGTACTPGASVACVCSSAATGAQVCKSDGSGYGACVCSPTGDAATADATLLDGARAADATVGDAAQADASVVTDATKIDAAWGDAALADTGTAEASGAGGDTGPEDAGTDVGDALIIAMDASEHDATTADAITTDTTAADASVVDASTSEAGPLDGSDGEAGNGGCGACTGTCTGGRCLTTLASGQNTPAGIAVDSTNVYWTDRDSNAVMSVPIGGGTPATLTTAGSSPYAIAVDAQNVYWTNLGPIPGNVNFPGNVMKCPIGGCGGAPTLLATSQMNPNSIAVLGGNVYWSAALATSAGFDTAAGMVVKCAVTGCAFIPTLIASDLTSTIGGIAVDATSVYWTMGGSNGAVASLAGGTLAYGPMAYAPIAVNAANVYWTTVDSVMMCPIGGCYPLTQTLPIVLCGLSATADGITVDDTSVYWTGSGGAVLKVPLAGGTPTVLASGQQIARGIAVDATSVYWTGGAVAGPGAVMKLTPK